MTNKTYILKSKQLEFLKLLLNMDKIKVLKLHPNDKSIILAVVEFGYYTGEIQSDLNRLRTRWGQPQPRADSNEYY